MYTCCYSDKGLTLLLLLLLQAEAAGKSMRRRVYCLFVEEWLDKPLVNPKP